MKTLSLKLPESLSIRLEIASRKKGESKSALARRVLDSYLNGETNPADLSSLDMIRDLVGIAEGPGDLSYNKKHMRGFGK